MEHRVLAGHGLAISVVGLGGVELCGGDATRGEPSLDEATTVVETAIDTGVNWIDTAESYDETRNEAFIGEVLRRVGADRLVSTKLAPSPNGSGFRRDEVHAACRASLTRLGRDQIDIYLLVRPLAAVRASLVTLDTGLTCS
jgi:aryl-alcohol dehydrogenase-like predicted oxidoreductase